MENLELKLLRSLLVEIESHLKECPICWANLNIEPHKENCGLVKQLNKQEVK